MPPGLALEAPRLYTSTFYFSAREEVCAGIELHVGCSCYVYIFFSSLLHQMLTSGNCPTPEKSLVLHQVIPKFHKRLTFQNTFLGSFCRKETTRWKNLLLTGGFKEQAKTSQTPIAAIRVKQWKCCLCLICGVLQIYKEAKEK